MNNDEDTVDVQINISEDGHAYQILVEGSRVLEPQEIIDAVIDYFMLMGYQSVMPDLDTLDS